MQLVRIDPDDRPVLPVQARDLEGVLPALYHVPVEFIPAVAGVSKFRGRLLCWMNEGEEEEEED